MSWLEGKSVKGIEIREDYSQDRMRIFTDEFTTYDVQNTVILRQGTIGGRQFPVAYWYTKS